MWKEMEVGGGGGSTADIEGLIPTMTSNTTPSGVASAISVYSNLSAYKAFDKIDNILNDNVWHAANGTLPAWLRYEFPSAVTVKTFVFIPLVPSGQNCRVKEYKFQASNDDGSTWTDLTEVLTCQNNAMNKNIVRVTKNAGNYKYYQMVISSVWTSGAQPAVMELQMYKEDIVFP